MRPDNLDKQDMLGNLLEKAWENPPAHLDQQLREIPTQIRASQSSKLDQFTFLLNSILILWGVALVMYFWTPLEKGITSISSGILGFTASSPPILAHPMVGFIALVCLVMGWVWTDLNHHPGRS